MQRYFVNNDQVIDNKIIINGQDCHHITNVMRMKLGDKVYVCSLDSSYIAEICNFTKENVELNIIETLDEKKELEVKITIAQGIVRREKMEEVIDYVCELGAYSYLPVIMKRSIIKLNKDDFNKKKDRLNLIAKEASEQSHRTKIMKVDSLVTWKEFLSLSKDYDLAIYAYESSKDDDSLKKIIKEKKYNSILVLIGPEGGIDETEVNDLKANNFLPVTLGPRILRTQVAPLYVMSAIAYELESKE